MPLLLLLLHTVVPVVYRVRVCHAAVWTRESYGCQLCYTTTTVYRVVSITAADDVEMLHIQ